MKPVILSPATSDTQITMKEVQNIESIQPKHSENAKKIQRLLKKRREMLAEQKLKLENEKQQEKPQKPPRSKSDAKEITIIQQPKSEPTTSEEYEEEDEHPETLTENSESYDSNDSLRCDVVAKDLEKG